MSDSVDVLSVQFPAGAENWNRANRGAFRKGWDACVSGEPRSACPYEDHRKPSGKLSWSRSFINSWRDGYSAALARVGGAK